MLEDWFFRGLFAFIVLVLLAGGYAVYQDAVAEKFELRKDQWTCAASHEERGFIWAGKVMVPTSQTVCDRWERK